MEGSTDPVAELQELLLKVEAVAQEVLIDKDEIINLDRRRNVNREAWRALKNSIKAEENRKMQKSHPILHSSEYSPNTWTCIGDMFIRMPKTALIESIDQGK